MFIHYRNEVENQLDRGGEYESPFALYSPQQNCVVERKNKTLKETMNAFLLNSGLPQNLCGETIISANYIFNRIPKKKSNASPYELWK